MPGRSYTHRSPAKGVRHPDLQQRLLSQRLKCCERGSCSSLVRSAWFVHRNNRDRAGSNRTVQLAQFHVRRSSCLGYFQAPLASENQAAKPSNLADPMPRSVVLVQLEYLTWWHLDSKA